VNLEHKIKHQTTTISVRFLIKLLTVKSLHKLIYIERSPNRYVGVTVKILRTDQIFFVIISRGGVEPVNSAPLNSALRETDRQTNGQRRKSKKTLVCLLWSLSNHDTYSIDYRHMSTSVDPVLIVRCLGRRSIPLISFNKPEYITCDFSSAFLPPISTLMSTAACRRYVMARIKARLYYRADLKEV